MVVMSTERGGRKGVCLQLFLGNLVIGKKSGKEEKRLSSVLARALRHMLASSVRVLCRSGTCSILYPPFLF